MRDEDEVVRIETVGKRRVYSEAEYDALRKHADEQQAEIERLEGINEVLDETMRSFAGQRLETEMPDDERENGDYRGAYDCMVRTARAAYRAAYPKEDIDG